MKIRPMGAELLHAGGRTDGRTDRQTDRQTRRSQQSLFEIFRKRPKTPYVRMQDMFEMAASSFSHHTKGTRAGGRKWVVRDGIRDGDRR